MTPSASEAFVEAMAALDTEAPGFPSSGEILMISTGLEQAFADRDPDRLLGISMTLEECFRRMLAAASAGTAQAILHGTGSPEIRAAYALGVLNMAQAVAGNGYWLRNARNVEASRAAA